MAQEGVQLDRYYESLLVDEDTAERQLWCSVLLSFAVDMKAIRVKELRYPHNKNLRDLKEQVLSEAFDPWCEQICENAGINVKTLRHCLIRISHMDAANLKRVRVSLTGDQGESLCNMATRHEVARILC